MKLSAPSQVFFLISLILAALAVISLFVVIPVVTAKAVWFAIAGYAVLAVACLMKGM